MWKLLEEVVGEGVEGVAVGLQHRLAMHQPTILIHTKAGIEMGHQKGDGQVSSHHSSLQIKIGREMRHQGDEKACREEASGCGRASSPHRTPSEI